MRRVHCFTVPAFRVAIVAMVLSALGAARSSSLNAEQSPQTGTIQLSPQDTYLKIDRRTYNSSTTVPVYTWPDNTVANAILMKFDLSAVPAGAVVTSATLHLSLVATDAKPEATYTVTAHKVLGRNPNIASATGYSADGVAAWTANNCCGGAPMAQADISPAYDAQAIDKVKAFKSWTLTTMVQEWMLDPAANFGVLLNADTSKLRDRYRTFASMEHSNAQLRPYLKLTYVAGDVTPPVAAVTSPAPGAVAGIASLAATASDNAAVAGVRYQLNGAAITPELTAQPYAFTWDTTSRSDGNYLLTAVARDTSGNTATSAALPVTIQNGVLLFAPQDTSLSIDANNYSLDPLLMTYTWPDLQPANAILMKFDLASLPLNAVVQDAKLLLALVQSDSLASATYNVTAHKVIGRNPLVPLATGFTSDGVTSWTPSSCCYNGVPLAQSDISPAYDTQAIDKTPGYKSWTVTAMVREWMSEPLTNFGMLLNSDASKTRDHYRYFASMENLDLTLRPVLRVEYSLNGDATPPAISNVASTGVTESAATITWTTDEPANSQVDYGPTPSYGTASTLSTASVTSHSVTLNGLTGGTQYHYRVRSRDEAGNLAMSGDFTFTTPDGTAPSVSISAPAAGASLAGTVSIVANASDNVGVAGVQFVVDGANLGAEDTAAPYSVSWNTTSVADGNHTLTAVARDATGNVTTSSPIIVGVTNAVPPPPPPSAGIASSYPGDVGIESDPNVVFVERFDEATLATLFGRWTDVSNGSSMSLTTDAPAGSPVGKSLTIPWSAGSTGGHLYRRLPQGVDDTLYVRYYVKYPSTANYDHTGIWMGGHNPPIDWPNPQAGVKPAGNDRFSAAAEQNELTRFDHYNYWMGMRQSGDGSYWGNYLLNNPNVKATADQWMCVEHMVKLNAPVTASNGEHAIWINGTKVSHLGQGFPNGSWSGGIFTQDPAGTPFQGFQWRNTSALNLNWIWLQVYATSGSGGVKYAHVVAAKSYIGCLDAGSSEPPPPPPPPPGGSALFTSNWDTAVGTSSAAVTDGGRWPNYWEFNGGSSTQLLSVVSGGVNGHNALRVQQRGSNFAANVQVDNLLPPSQDFYMRYYMRNDDTSNAGDHIVTADTYNYANLTYMRKYGGAANWTFVMSLYGCGYIYPIGHWGPTVSLANGQWYRFEYFVDYVSATRVQVHPRVYDANGTLILSDADFKQSDFGGASWNGRSDWTLASYYAAGHSFCVDPSWMNDFGLGNNGQYGAADTGKYWYFSAFEVRTDRWPGAVQ